MASAHLLLPHLTRIRNKSCVLAGILFLGCFCVLGKGTIRACLLKKDGSLLNFLLWLIRDLWIICRQFVSPFPAGLHLTCNFCSCQSLFLSLRPFCKNMSCSEGFLTFINSAGGVEGFYWGFGEEK